LQDEQQVTTLLKDQVRDHTMDFGKGRGGDINPVVNLTSQKGKAAIREGRKTIQYSKQEDF